MIKIIIADDILILRQGLKAVLEQDSELQVIGMAANGLEAYELCKTNLPDVVLMDMCMPNYDGSFGTQKIKAEFSDVKVLVLTTFDDKETIDTALTSGADGYILKEMEDIKIINSIKAVANGVHVFGQNIFQQIRPSFTRQEDTSSLPSKSNAFIEKLSERELDIIYCITEGMDNKEIAATLFLAEGTVRNNISRILEKLQLKDRTQLAVFAVKHNLDDRTLKSTL